LQDSLRHGMTLYST